MKITANWFKPSQFAFISGLLATACMLGAIFGQAPLAALLNHEGSWRATLQICAWLGVILSVLFYLFVRNEPQHALTTNNTHNSYSLSFADFWQVLCNKRNWLLTFYSGLAFAPTAVFGGLWGTPFIREAYQLSNTQAAAIVSLAFLGLAIGGPVLGFVSDYIQKRLPVMFFGCLLSFLSISTAVYMPHLPVWMLRISLFLFGFGTGAFMLGFVIGKELNKIALAATVIALINTGDAIFGAFTEPLVGKILDLGWQHQLHHGVPYFTVANFHKAFLILPLYLLTAMILVLFIREAKK